MPAASILIKPASSGCNIACKYCFYHSIADSRKVADYGIMSMETLDCLVREVLTYADGYACFAFQGGEPTLVGLPFYEEAVRLQKKYNYKGLTIQNTIQTNGTLLDEAWAVFLKENHFLVGLSLDGTRGVNDFCRVTKKGESIFDREMETAHLLQKYQVDVNAVSVVTEKTVDRVNAVYRFLKEKGFCYLQFIPCMENKPGEKKPYTLTPKRYGEFLCSLFDLWYEDYVSGVSIDIRMFSNLVQMAAGFAPEECGMCGHCTTYFVVESDGGVYPCDFYTQDAWRLGRIEDGFQNLFDSALSQKFMDSSEPVSDACSECAYYDLCRGGCRRWRDRAFGGKLSCNALCEGYKMFFYHTQDRIRRLGVYLRGRYMENT